MIEETWPNMKGNGDGPTLWDCGSVDLTVNRSVYQKLNESKLLCPYFVAIFFIVISVFQLSIFTSSLTVLIHFSL